MNHSTDSHPDQRAGITVGTVTYLVWGLLTVYWKQLTGFDDQRRSEVFGRVEGPPAALVGELLKALGQVVE